MARILACDGCLSEVAKAMSFPPFNRVYCEACAEKLKAYMEERDALHTEVSKAWNERLRALREKHAPQFKGRLPDAS